VLRSRDRAAIATVPCPSTGACWFSTLCRIHLQHSSMFLRYFPFTFSFMLMTASAFSSFCWVITGLIGFNSRRLQGPKMGMSSHATDLSVYAKSSSSVLCLNLGFLSVSIVLLTTASFSWCYFVRVSVCSVTWLFLLDCQCQCKWLTGKTRLRNDL